MTCQILGRIGAVQRTQIRIDRADVELFDPRHAQRLAQ